MNEQRDSRLATLPVGSGHSVGNVGTTSAESALRANQVLRNTYLLLAATLLFSAAMAGVSMWAGMPYPGPIVTLVGYFGLLFLTYRLRNQTAGLVAVFALTGFMGATLGPILSAYMTKVPNGSELIMTSLGITGVLFTGLSAFVVKTRRDFSFLRSFLLVGLIGMVLVVLAGLFIDLSAFQMAISAGIVLLMSGFILYDTSSILTGEQDNYILATVGLYVNIYNIFVNLLSLLGLGGSDD
jgi:modulator of FtsH protease